MTTTALPLLSTWEQAGLGTVTRSGRCYPEGVSLSRVELALLQLQLGGWV